MFYGVEHRETLEQDIFLWQCPLGCSDCWKCLPSLSSLGPWCPENDKKKSLKGNVQRILTGVESYII
jgi:hypothetical protein